MTLNLNFCHHSGVGSSRPSIVPNAVCPLLDIELLPSTIHVTAEGAPLLPCTDEVQVNHSKESCQMGRNMSDHACKGIQHRPRLGTYCKALTSADPCRQTRRLHRESR